MRELVVEEINLWLWLAQIDISFSFHSQLVRRTREGEVQTF